MRLIKEQKKQRGRLSEGIQYVDYSEPEGCLGKDRVSYLLFGLLLRQWFAHALLTSLLRVARRVLLRLEALCRGSSFCGLLLIVILSTWVSLVDHRTITMRYVYLVMPSLRLDLLLMLR